MKEGTYVKFIYKGIERKGYIQELKADKVKVSIPDFSAYKTDWLELSEVTETEEPEKPFFDTKYLF